MSLLHFLAGAAAAKILTSGNPDIKEESRHDDPYGRKFVVDTPTDESFIEKRPKTFIFLLSAGIFVPSVIIAIFIVKLFYS